MAELRLQHRTIATIGRLGALPWTDAAAKIAAAGASLRRGVSRRTDLVVVGHAAHELLAGGRLERRLAQVPSGAKLISENTLWRLVGLRPPLAAAERPFALEQIAQQTKLPLQVVRLLALFDVLETDLEGRGTFRELSAGRTVAKRVAEGATLAEILGAFHRRRGADLVHVGAALAGDEQIKLPLPDAGNPSADELFEAAYIAEEDGALEVAETLYRRCLHAERRDPTTAYNLANVLAALGRNAESRAYYERALAMDPKFVEARYNLAHVLDRAGDPAAAKQQLIAALKADPKYADALFNLATHLTREEDLAEAVPLWERYLALDSTTEWAEKARQSLSICRRLLNAAASA